LLDGVAAGDSQMIAPEILALKAGFSVGAIDEASAYVIALEYVKALEEFPVWTVTEACRRFRSGRTATAWKPSYCPTSAQVANECRDILQPFHDELTALRDVLDAEIAPAPDPDAAARLKAVMRWEDELRPAMPPPIRRSKGPPEDPHAALARFRSEGLGPVLVIGAGLQAKFDSMKGAKP
jgi:hypothetical protein